MEITRTVVSKLHLPALTRMPFYLSRGSEEDLKELKSQMSDVQRLVHLAARFTPEMRKDWTKRLFDEGRETYRQALQEELNRHGCASMKAVVPDRGPELKAIKDRVDFAVSSIEATYNAALAKEIVAIGKAVPTANRYTYAHRLFGAGGWDSGYWSEQIKVISHIETLTLVNAGIEDFYERNDDLVELEEIWILPMVAACDVCKELIGGNPYKTVHEATRISVIPAHVNCVHWISARAGKRMDSEDCKLLWAGM